VSVSCVVAVKRLWLGLYLGKYSACNGAPCKIAYIHQPFFLPLCFRPGKKTFAAYAESLAKVVQKLVILADVAALGRTFLVDSLEDDQSRRQLSVSRFGMNREEVRTYTQRERERE